MQQSAPSLAQVRAPGERCRPVRIAANSPSRCAAFKRVGMSEIW